MIIIYIRLNIVLKLISVGVCGVGFFFTFFKVATKKYKITYVVRISAGHHLTK